GLGSLVYQSNKMAVEHLGKYAQHLCIIAGNAYFYSGLEITGTIRTACIASKLALTWRKFILMKPLTSLAHNITFYPARVGVYSGNTMHILPGDEVEVDRTVRQRASLSFNFLYLYHKRDFGQRICIQIRTLA